MLSERHLPHNERDTKTESKGMEKGVSCKWKQKKSWGNNTYITYINKTDFNIEAIIRDKEKHYIMIKESVQPEDI